MEIVWLTIAFATGASFGSFLNVVAYRYNTGLSISGRSVCLSCGYELRWYDLVPVASFVALRAKCRKCTSKISFQYPLVELLTAAVFSGIAAKVLSVPDPAAIVEGAFQAAAWCFLIAILVYDFRHKIIPDAFVAAFIVISIARIIAAYGMGESQSGLASLILAGPVLAAPFAFLWLVSKGRWIGLGDGKLVLGFGWMLGLSRALSAILIGFWTGAIFSVLVISAGRFPKVQRALRLPKYVTGKTEIPFAPFLILGYALVYFFELAPITF